MERRYCLKGALDLHPLWMAPVVTYKSCIYDVSKFRTDEPKTEPVGTEDFCFVCRNSLKPGGHAVILAGIFMIGMWISTLNGGGLIITLYHQAFLYYSETVLNYQNTKFPENMVQYAVITRTPGTHPQHFQPHFNSKFSDVDCPFSKSDATISNVRSAARKHTWWDSWQSMWKTEKLSVWIDELSIFYHTWIIYSWSICWYYARCNRCPG